MPIVHEFPPNFELIKGMLPLAGSDHTYCYAGKIYNPSGVELPIDREYHEFIHARQQSAYGDVDLWWSKYLSDAQFRLDQEIEAYGEQYKLAKQSIQDEADRLAMLSTPKRIGGGVNAILQMAKESMARALSGPEYGSLISYSEAESAIRRYGK